MKQKIILIPHIVIEFFKFKTWQSDWLRAYTWQCEPKIFVASVDINLSFQRTLGIKDHTQQMLQDLTKASMDI